MHVKSRDVTKLSELQANEKREKIFFLDFLKLQLKFIADTIEFTLARRFTNVLIVPTKISLSRMAEIFT